MTSPMKKKKMSSFEIQVFKKPLKDIFIMYIYIILFLFTHYKHLLFPKLSLLTQLLENYSIIFFSFIYHFSGVKTEKSKLKISKFRAHIRIFPFNDNFYYFFRSLVRYLQNIFNFFSFIPSSTDFDRHSSRFPKFPSGQLS